MMLKYPIQTKYFKVKDGKPNIMQYGSTDTELKSAQSAIQQKQLYQ